MKIVVDKIAAQMRANAIVDRIKNAALETASQGKINFAVELKTDELNGIEPKLLVAMVNKEFEGTVKFKGEPLSTIMLLEIVESRNKISDE